MSADSCTSTISNDINLESLPTMLEPNNNNNNNYNYNCKNINQKSNNKKDLQANTKSFMFAKHKSFSLANLATSSINNNKASKHLDSNNNSIDDYEDEDEFEANGHYKNSETFNSINLDEVFDGFTISNEQNDDDSSFYQLAARNIDPLSTTTTSNQNQNNYEDNTNTTSSKAVSNNKLSQNTNNKVIRSFLKLIRPSLNRKRKNRHMNAKSTSNLSFYPNTGGKFDESFELNTFKILSANETKKKSGSKKKTRSKLRSCRSIGVLNEATTASIMSDRGGEDTDIDIEIFNIKENRRSKSKSVCRINSSIEISDLKSISNERTHTNKSNKATRAFSLLNKSSMFSSSLSSYNSVTVSSNTNNSNSNQLKSNPVLSKELTWYKLQELDGYYKILEHVMEETKYNILNVIEILQEKFVILTGGCTRNGSLIFTFTDNCSEKEINVEHYRKAIDYFCNIPSESDKQIGFSILIDRRNDKWSSVRNVLILIQDYFPAKLNSIFILRPQSYFQRVLSSLFFQEDSLNSHNNISSESTTNTSRIINNNNSNKNRQLNQTTSNTAKNLNIKVCKTVDDLYDSIDKNQLTTEFGGLIHYRHQEWIEQRQFIEKLSSNVNECVSNLKLFIKSMEETDFPNDVSTTEILINSQLRERGELLSTVFCTRRFGETVLDVIEKTSRIDMYQNKTEKYSALTPDIRIHYQTVFNLLKLMEESELTLETFWKNHFVRLNKCLDLRKFEQKFKDVRINLLNIHEKFNRIDEEHLQSEEEYENCINLLQTLNEESKSVFEEASNLYDQGIDLLITNKISQNNGDLSDSLTSSNQLFNISTTNSLNLEDSNSAEDIKIDYQSQSSQSNNMKNRCNNSNSTKIMNLDQVSVNKEENNFSIDTQPSSLVNFELSNDQKNFSETSFPASISFLRNPTVMPPALSSNNNAGYCVDSVEPKCNELKRLIDEFKFSYMQKLSIFKNNKIILKKLNLAKNCYTNGYKLFNEQQLINMNQEKARKYLKEIEEWINQLETTDFSCPSEDNNATLISDENNNNNSNNKKATNSYDKFKLKEISLVKNFELVCTQIKSLGSLFEKRQEQLKKIAFPIISKPVQRVEPQYNEQAINNLSLSSTSSSSSSSLLSSSSSSNQQSDITKFNSNLIKRDSMQKAYDKGNLSNLNNSLNATNNNNNNSIINTRKTSDDSSSSSINEDDEIDEQKKSHDKKLKHILNELIDTERAYVNELKLIIEGYLEKINDSNNHPQIPSIVLANLDILFGNIKEIYLFHNRTFLKELETAILSSISDISNLFVKCKMNFYLYSTYCLNKPHSEEIWREYCSSCSFFKSVQLSLGLKLPLDTYLLKPVQRISKYQLLLKELQKCCPPSEKLHVDRALETMLDVVNNLNDVMHASFIVGCGGDIKQFGRLLKRDQLQMSKVKRTTSNKSSIVNRLKLNETNKLVEIFLFEKSIIICKRKADTDPSLHVNVLTTPVVPQNLISPSSSSVISAPISVSSTSNFSSLSNQTSTIPNSSAFSSLLNCQYVYQFKELLMTNEIGLTENLKNDKKKFEIWSDISSYIFEASNEQEKQAWTAQIKNLLEYQLNEIKSKYQTVKLENIATTQNNNRNNVNTSRKNSSKKYKTSPLSRSSTLSNETSSLSSTSSNRANSIDCDFDTDISESFFPNNNSLPNTKMLENLKLENTSKIVTIHHRRLQNDTKSSNQIRQAHRITNDLPAQLLTIDHDKIMTF